MPKNPEAKFQTNVVIPFLERLPKTDFTKIQQLSLCGDPDLFIVCNSFAIYMELKKAKSEKAKKLQRFKLLKGQRAGAYSMVVSPENWSDAKYFLEVLSNENNVVMMEMPECLKLKLEPLETQFFTTQ